MITAKSNYEEIYDMAYDNAYKGNDGPDGERERHSDAIAAVVAAAVSNTLKKKNVSVVTKVPGYYYGEKTWRDQGK